MQTFIYQVRKWSSFNQMQKGAPRISKSVEAGNVKNWYFIYPQQIKLLIRASNVVEISLTMTRMHSLVPALTALILTMALPMQLRAFAECTLETEDSAPAAKVEEQSAPDYDGIVALRLKINNDGKIVLISKDVVDGKWQDNRNIPVGPRLYYEVIDGSGSVIARGFRRDPRNMHSGSFENFILTVPYKTGASSVNIYIMDYENGGRSGYSRQFSLLASVDISERMTTSLQ